MSSFLLLGRNKNGVCFDAGIMNALSDNSEHRSRIMRQELGIRTITGLHVKEGERTEMVGNRISLYEQLTVSAQRFAKLSDSSTPSSSAFSRLEHSIFRENQRSSSSLPLSFLPPLDKARSFTCPFFGTIEGTVACESRSNDATRRQPAVASNVLFKTRAITTMGENLDHTTSKRSEALLPSNQSNENKVLEECLALLSSNHYNENKDVSISLVSGQDTPGADVMMLVKGAQTLSIGDGLRSASTCNEGCTYVGSESKKMVSTVDVLPKAVAQDHNKSLGEQDAKQKISSGHCLQQVKTFEVGHSPESQDKGMPLDAAVDAQDQGECCSSERCMIIEEGDHDATSRLASAHASPQERNFTRRKMKLELALLDQDAKVPQKTQESLIPSLDVMAGGSTDDAEAPDDMQAENCLNDVKAGGAPPILPKSVIQAVGQLRFWKARLSLIRQQRIFSDQVFELHKLIEVQRLIAGTPNVPINEMYFGVGNMITDSDDNASPCGFVHQEEDNAEAWRKQVSASQEVGKAPAIVRKANFTLCYGQANCPANTAMPENEVNAWRYSSLGVAPWAAQASTQSGASPYPPFVLRGMESFGQDEVRGEKRQKGRKEVARGQDVVDGFTTLNPFKSPLNLFPLAPTLTSDDDTRRPSSGGKGHVIKVVPRAAKSAPESAAGILSSILQERKP